MLEIELQSTANQIPDVEAPTPQVLTEGDDWTLQIVATDAEDALEYGLVNAPAGMSIGLTTGLISWTPDLDDSGSYTVGVTVTDNVNAPVQVPLELDVFQLEGLVPLFRVNAGGPAVAATDEGYPSWDSDRDYLTNTVSPYYTDAAPTPGFFPNLPTPQASYSPITDLTGPSVPPSTPLEVFQTERNEVIDAAGIQTMDWNFPIPDGTQVEVRLGFGEIYTPAESTNFRVFDIAIDGVEVESAFDAFAVGGLDAAVVMDYVVTVTGGDGLDISLSEILDRPAIKSIEILNLAPRSITLDAPSDGEMITGDEITVAWTESNTLVSDHVHAMLENPDLPGGMLMQGSLETSPYTFTSLPPGDYDVTVTIANLNHTEYTNPEATQTVTVTLEAGGPGMLWLRR